MGLGFGLRRGGARLGAPAASISAAAKPKAAPLPHSDGTRAHCELCLRLQLHTMERVLRAAVLLAALGLGDSIFGDTENLWDDGYSDEPGWSATVEAYRQVEYKRRAALQHEAGEAAVQIAITMACALLTLFLAGSLGVWKLSAKEAKALHQYVMDHHQNADAVDQDSGTKNKLDVKAQERGRVGLESHDYMERVDGRFGLVSHLQESTSTETAKQKLSKWKKHTARVNTAVERAFDAVDTDKSGELTRDELRELLNHMSQPHSDDVLDEIMERFDPDHSGTVSLIEFREAWEENAQMDSDANNAPTASVVSGSKRAARENLGK